MKRTLDDDANEEMMTIDEADNYVLCYVPNLLLGSDCTTYTRSFSDVAYVR